jgi:hypothetical protein
VPKTELLNQPVIAHLVLMMITNTVYVMTVHITVKTVSWNVLILLIHLALTISSIVLIQLVTES